MSSRVELSAYPELMGTDNGTLRVLVIGDAGNDNHGYVGERLRGHGGVTEPLDRDRLPVYEDVREGGVVDLVLLLGSVRSGADPEQSHVLERESGFVRDALDDGVPVLGICYGSQLLAHALGGAIKESPQPEVGLVEVTTNDPVLCPAGPWIHVHSDTFVPPPYATVFGSTPGGCAGFTDESCDARVLAWQFHPEATPDQLDEWLADLAADFAAEHCDDPDAFSVEAHRIEDQLRDRAYALTDAALDWLLDRPDVQVAS